MYNNEFTFLGTRYNIFSSIIFLSAFFLLISLGNWQLKRLSEKEEFIKKIDSNLNGLPKTIESVKAQPFYSKVSITGRFLPNKTILLYGKRSAHPENDGYYILTAFEAENGQVYLVSRGWIAQSKKNELLEFSAREINDNIEAVILPGENKGYFMPANDINKNIWFTIDLKLAQNTLAITETNFYLMQINSHTLPNGGQKLSATNLNKVRNDHMEYAITWYSLAASLAVIFIMANTKRGRNQIKK
jgi:surfeit locus 1 family protein